MLDGIVNAGTCGRAAWYRHLEHLCIGRDAELDAEKQGWMGQLWTRWIILLGTVSSGVRQEQCGRAACHRHVERICIV